MSKYDACVISAFTSAGAFVVTTKPALFYGVCVSGSADATTINVFDGKTTAGTKIWVAQVPATASDVVEPSVPIVCGSGIVATNVGTVVTYGVMYVIND